MHRLRWGPLIFGESPRSFEALAWRKCADKLFCEGPMICIMSPFFREDRVRLKRMFMGRTGPGGGQGKPNKAMASIQPTNTVRQLTVIRSTSEWKWD